MIYKIIFASVLVSCSILTPAHSTSDDRNNQQLPHQVKIQQKTVLLAGNPAKVGDMAPEFKVVDEQFNPVKLSDFRGTTVVLSVVPSIDTGICSLQTKRFNDDVGKKYSQVKLLTISADLPFAQKRFCIEEDIHNHQLLSDSVWRQFGQNYGLLIRNMGLLSRAVLIIDAQGKLVYQQVVAQLSQEPDYQDVLANLQTLLPPEQLQPSTPDIESETEAEDESEGETHSPLN